MRADVLAGRYRGIGAGVFTLLGVAGLLTAMAPWGTWRLALTLRAEYFLLCGLCWKAGLFAGRRALSGLAPAGTGPGRLVLVVLIGSMPGCAGIVLTIRLLLGHWVPLLPLYGQTLALGLGVAFAYRGLFSTPTRTAEPASPPAMPPLTHPVPTGAAAFLHRHAPPLARARLLALEAEDHYLRIHTDAGSALVLLRLRDAVEALGPAAGWQPHRSFWLANGVRARTERRGQGWQLLLEHGLTVPVSRSAVPAMRRAGFGQPLSDCVRARPVTVSSTAE